MNVTVERKVYYPRVELCKLLGLDPKKVCAINTDGFGVEVVMSTVEYQQDHHTVAGL